MKKYKVIFTYKENSTVISTHEVINEIVNANDLELTFAREKLYEGIFIEMVDSLQFIKEDKTYLDSVYLNWLTKLSSQFYLNIKLFIFDNVTLKDALIYKGIASFETIVRNETITEISFLEENITNKLLEVQDVEVEIFPTITTKQLITNIGNLANAESPCRFSKNLVQSPDTGWGTVVPRTFELNLFDPKESKIFTLDENEKLIIGGYPYAIDLKIGTLLHGSWTLAKTGGGIDVDPTTWDIKIYLQITNVNDFTDRYLIYSHSGNSVTGLPINRTFTSNLLDFNTLHSLVPNEKVIVSLGLDIISNKTIAQDFFIGVGGGLIESIRNSDVEFYAKDFVPEQVSDIKVIKFQDAFTSLKNSINLIIKDNLLNDYIKNLHFLKSKGLNLKDFSINTSLKKMIEKIKVLGYLGLDRDVLDDNLRIVPLDLIYNDSLGIIDLGEAIEMKIDLNPEMIFNILNLGSTDKAEKDYFPTTEYLLKTIYEFKVGVALEKNLLINSWKVQPTYIDNLLYQLFFIGIVKESKDLMIAFSEHANNIFETTFPITDGYHTTGWNAEVSTNKLLTKWARWLKGSIISDFEELDYSSTDANKLVEIGSGVKLINDSFSYDDSIFNTVDALFGTQKYEFKLPVKPEIHNLIKENIDKRFKILYKGNDYIFFLKNMNIKLFNDSITVIKGVEAFKKI